MTHRDHVKLTYPGTRYRGRYAGEARIRTPQQPLLDDVGLLVFDEGHMIDLNEREVRYEVQIQRLLLPADAHERRIVCLSAILPDGDQLEALRDGCGETAPVA